MIDYSGKQFGNYHLISFLGMGDFAQVYLGEDARQGSQVAVKVLKIHVTGEKIESFQAEARRLSWLRHPNIVKIRDFGIEAGAPFLVIDYAPNGTLRKRHPAGKILSPETILPYIKQVAEALQYAHGENVIHCDIKPENLLIGPNNEIMLGDFSLPLIAHASDTEADTEFPQGVAGTVSYMAPEQFQRRPRPASDQYALAVVIYEWLTGEPPFQGSFSQIASGHLFNDPLSLREKRPDLSAALDNVVLKALSKNPSQRFASIQEFVKAFEQACISLPGAVPNLQTGLSVDTGADEGAPPPDTTRLSPLVVKVSDSTGSASSGRTGTFISYSHRDKKHLDRLRVYLQQYAFADDVIDFWDDTRIVAGADWQEEIKRAIESARIAILLVSADFLASDFIMKNELPPLLEAAERGGASILPVVIGPCDFKHSKLGRYQSVNPPSKPLMGMANIDREWVWFKVAQLVSLRDITEK